MRQLIGFHLSHHKNGKRFLEPNRLTMRVTQQFRNAQYLAEFAALEPQNVEYWRKNHPEFVPEGWWGYAPTDSMGKPLSTKLWQLNQEWLREAWQKHFNIGQFDMMRLMTSVFDPDNIDVIGRAFGKRVRPTFATLTDMPQEFYPYQQAVLYLKEQNWRAGLCERCKAPFVAGHNRQKYCGRENDEGETCFTLARREQKQRDHAKHRKSRNKKRREMYAASIGKE